MHKPACPENAREPKGRTPRQQARAIASESSTQGQPHRGLPHKQCGTQNALSIEALCKRPLPGAVVSTVLSADGCCAGKCIRWPERSTTGESCNRNVDGWFVACLVLACWLIRSYSFKSELVDRAVYTTAFSERHGAENCIRCLEPPTRGEVRLQRLGSARRCLKLAHFAKESFLL